MVYGVKVVPPDGDDTVHAAAPPPLAAKQTRHRLVVLAPAVAVHGPHLPRSDHTDQVAS